MDSCMPASTYRTPQRRPRRQWACAAASVLLVMLAGGSPTLAGLIELGIAGQTAEGSVFHVIVDGQTFTEGTHVVGESAASIAGKVRANIDASPLFSATIPDPGKPTQIKVLRESGGQPATLEVNIDDGGIVGTFIEFGTDGGSHFHLAGAMGVAGNGSFQVDVTVHPGILFSHAISTVGKTDAQVNAALVAAFTADGFTFAGPANGPWDVTKSGSCFSKVEMKATDTGVHISNVELDSTPAPSIPTLSEWGMLTLVALLGLSAAVLLVRRRAGRSI